MKTILLTAGQARIHFPILFDHAVTRRSQKLPYSKEDADSFDHDLFVVTGCAEFRDVPMPIHVEFRGEETVIVNAESLPKRIVANGLSLDNSRMNNERLGWNAGEIEFITCDTLHLMDPKTFPRRVEACDVTIVGTEEGNEYGLLDFGASELALISENLSVHLPLLQVIGELPDENIASVVIKVENLELDKWTESPSIIRHWNSSEITNFNIVDCAVRRYRALRRTKRRLTQSSGSFRTDMDVQIELG